MIRDEGSIAIIQAVDKNSNSTLKFLNLVVSRIDPSVEGIYPECSCNQY